jgi:hypothetical protein
LGDAAVFSTFGKKKAPELREVLSAIRSTVVSGYERIRSAEQGLASDEDLSSALASLADIDKAVSGAEAWSTGIAARAARLEATPKAELRAFSDELAAKYRILSDSRLALGRVEDTVPKTKEILSARIDVVRRRIDGTSAYIKKTKSAVDTEIRDPAIARAKRAQNIRWAFLHEPSGALALRLFSPFGLDPSSNDIAFVDTGRFEFSLRAEGAFGGDKGVWIASSIEKDDAVLASLAADDGLAKNTGYSQFVDLGFYGRGLFGAGFSWDWLRQVDGDSALKRSAVRVFAGGMDEADERAAWLIALSWEFPYDMDEFAAANILNAGLDAFLRMGKVVELNAGLALRPRANSDSAATASELYDASFRYSAGAGFRLPPPFMWGIEFSGYAVKTIGGAPEGADSYVRMFIEYSL